MAVETTPLLGSNGPAYTIFTPAQKLAIICTATLASVFSPFSANIYYPAMSDIRKELNLTETLVNTTITSYMIFQGLSPLVVGSSSDSAGRRPVYILCFSIYAVANVALAFQREYWGLLLLRCLQSTGSSSLVNLAYAVTADVVTSSERGKYIGFASVGPIIGPSLGPVVGGIISKNLGWRWIFVFLAGAALIMLIGIVAFMPETCRAVVGDGSVEPPSAIHKSLISYCISRKKQEDSLLSDDDSLETERQAKLAKPKKRVSPLDAINMLWKYPLGLVLVYNGIQYAGYYAIMASLTFSFEDIYGFDQVQISLAYLLIGLGTMVAAFGNGFIVDWNFRRHARKAGFEPAEVKTMDPEDARKQGFCIERARLEIAIPEISMAAKIMVAYAWCMYSGKHAGFAMALLFMFGIFATAAYSCLNVLIVDLSRDSPATGTAANNLVRCSIAAGGTAAVMPVINAVGIGWAFTAVAGLWIIAMPMILVVSWRKNGEEEAEEDVSR